MRRLLRYQSTRARERRVCEFHAGTGRTGSIADGPGGMLLALLFVAFILRGIVVTEPRNGPFSARILLLELYIKNRIILRIKSRKN